MDRAHRKCYQHHKWPCTSIINAINNTISSSNNFMPEDCFKSGPCNLAIRNFSFIFVSILCLFCPILIWAEIWRRSDGSSSRNYGDGYQFDFGVIQSDLPHFGQNESFHVKKKRIAIEKFFRRFLTSFNGMRFYFSSFSHSQQQQ